jgi:nucleoside-diphosphate-sugar epimerase
MKTISILGVGWFGKPLGVHLVKSGYKVFGSTTNTGKLSEIEKEGIVPVLLKFNPGPEGDENIKPFFQSEVLIVGIPPKRKAGLGEEYIKQIEAIIEASKSGSIRKILLISSTAVYPDSDLEVVEDSLTESEENVMVKAENLIKKSGINYTIIRFAGLVGPGRHPGKFLGNKTGVTGANCPVNLIHLDDCNNIISLIIEKGIWNEVFNACSDLHPLKKDFYDEAAKKLSLTPPTFSLESRKYKIINSDKIKNRLNYSFKFPDPYQMI